MFQFGNSQVQYISPGISFSWDLNGRYIFSPKLSYGVLSNGLYINATIGSSSATDDKSYPNSYLEFQIGQI